VIRPRAEAKPIVSFVFRVNARGGGHTHVTIFAGVTPGSRGRCGGLVMRDEEWAALQKVLEQGQHGATPIIVEEGA
jgi:hypothetical protein